ncbi:hypothetical protein FRB90_012698 [Tulasnella sp. 427]|nr:hypothetical protein FRB90_012698 [Tulasnella sp. 427]
MSLTAGNWNAYPPNSIAAGQNGSATIAWSGAKGTDGTLIYTADKGVQVGATFKIPVAAPANTALGTINSARSPQASVNLSPPSEWILTITVSKPT